MGSDSNAVRNRLIGRERGAVRTRRQLCGFLQPGLVIWISLGDLVLIGYGDHSTVLCSKGDGLSALLNVKGLSRRL